MLCDSKHFIATRFHVWSDYQDNTHQAPREKPQLVESNKEHSYAHRLSRSGAFEPLNEVMAIFDAGELHQR